MNNSPALSPRLAALDFTSYIKRLTEDFAGRTWVFDKIDRWLKSDGQRFFILTGEPGVGKSALAAQFIQMRRDIVAYHFCIAGRNSTITPGTVLRSLAAQLGEHLPQYGMALANTIKPEFLSVAVKIDVNHLNGGQITGVVIENLHALDPKQELDILLRAPLADLPAPETPLVMLVDSLDEAVTYQGDINLVTLLSGLDDLPGWARFICTSRPERRVLRYFDRLQTYTLAAESQMNLDDVRQYVNHRVNKETLQARLAEAQVELQSLSDYLIALSAGNFLYIKVLLNDIESGQQSLDDLAALPRSLDEIYHGFLRRFSENEWEERYQPLLGILAVAQEPLTEAQLANFCGITATQVRQRLGVVRQFLDTQGDGPGTIYALFHQSLRDYLLDGERNCDFWCAPQDGHWAIAAYFLDSFQRKWQDCSLYGFKYIVTHLRQAQRWDKLVEVLTELDFAVNKMKHLSAEALLEDMYLAYVSLQEHEKTARASEICNALLKYLLNFGSIRNEVLSVETIQASLVYRPQKDFYQEFLRLGLDERSIRTLGGEHVDIADVVVSFTARLANLQRRTGDLEEAESLLRKLLQNLEPRLGEVLEFLREYARIEYDLGYINYLRGQFRAAADTLRQSAAHANQGGDTIGEWISRCVEYHVRFVGELGSSDDFERVLNQALAHFIRESEGNTPHPHAQRWIMNVHAHLFEIMYTRNDIPGAAEQLAALQKDKWIARYGGEHFLMPYLARFCILQQDWAGAIGHFKQYFDTLAASVGEDGMCKQEAIVMQYYDYGRALKGAGKEQEATKIWEEAMLCSGEPGNHIWKTKIEQELALLG